MKRYLAVILMIVLAVLPCAAFALSGGSPGLIDYRYGTGNKSAAKDYVIKFGLEHSLIRGTSILPRRWMRCGERTARPVCIPLLMCTLRDGAARGSSCVIRRTTAASEWAGRRELR